MYIVAEAEEGLASSHLRTLSPLEIGAARQAPGRQGDDEEVVQLAEQEETRPREHRRRQITIKLPGCYLPRETRDHMRASVREMLLAWRSTIDAAIECVEERDESDRKPVKIEID